MDKQKIKRQWEYLNNLGIFTIEEAIEFNKKLVLNIGTLGCRFTKEQIDNMRGDKSNANNT